MLREPSQMSGTESGLVYPINSVWWGRNSLPLPKGTKWMTQCVSPFNRCTEAQRWQAGGVTLPSSGRTGTRRKSPSKSTRPSFLGQRGREGRKPVHLPKVSPGGSWLQHFRPVQLATICSPLPIFWGGSVFRGTTLRGHFSLYTQGRI